MLAQVSYMKNSDEKHDQLKCYNPSTSVSGPCGIMLHCINPRFNAPTNCETAQSI